MLYQATGLPRNLKTVDSYDNVQTFAFFNIDKFSTASIVTRLTTDVTNIQNAYQMLIRMAIRGPVMLIFSMIVSFRINSTIALIFLAVIPVMAFLLYLIIHKVNPIFNREDYETDKFKSISEKIYHYFSKGEKLIAFNSPIMQFLCMPV